MSHSAKAVANSFLELANSAGEILTPMKLQKLVYFAHGWHLALRSTPLLDEQVEAWTYGPVIPSLYHEFKEFGDGAITRPARDWKWQNTDGTGWAFDVKIPQIPEDGSKETVNLKALLKRVWDVYSRYSAIQLSNMTHETGSPWAKVIAKYNDGVPRGTDIPPEFIREYFLAQAARKN